MTAQEQQLIDELVERIRNTPVQNKDTAAEQRLQQGLAGLPDALYVLAQTVIVQKYGLEQAQQRLQSLQSELDALRSQGAQDASSKPSGGSSFLSHIFGGGAPSTPQNTQPAPAPPAQGGWQSVNSPGYPQAGYAPAPGGYPPPGYGQPSGWGGSSMGGGFLQSALQTAAGVAMGEMAFQGMESLFHGFGGGGGGGYGRGFEGDRPSETIINNYGDSERPRHEEFGNARDRDDDSSFYNPHRDASRDSESHGFADSGQVSRDDDDGDRNNFADDNNSDGADDNSDSDDSDDSSFDSGDDSSFSSSDNGS